MSLRDWDKIAVSVDEANRLATNGLVLEEGRIVIDADNARVIDELLKRKIDVIPLPFDGPISLRRRAALRAPPAAARKRFGLDQATNPVRTEYLGRRAWACGRRRTGLGRFIAFLALTPSERASIAA